MSYHPSNYLDNKTKLEIEKALLFLKTAKWKNEDEVYDKIAEDFDVPKTAVKEIAKKLTHG